MCIFSFWQETTKQFLEYESQAVRLWLISGDIIPLRLRKGPITEPIKVVALVDYKLKDITVKENEEVILLDNSQTTKWKVN